MESYEDDNNTVLRHNAEITDTVEDRLLTVKEIRELQLYMNPADGDVYKLVDGNLIKDERYYYCSY